jgi:hypothetical protein
MQTVCWTDQSFAREILIMSARLYFDLVDTHQSIPDREGIEVDDVDQAKVAVAEMLEEHRQGDASTAREWSGWTLSVRDGAGHVLFSVDLDSHVQPQRPRFTCVKAAACEVA